MTGRFSQPTAVKLTQPYLELNNQGQTLRFYLQEGRYQLGRDRAWSNLEIPERDWGVLSRKQAVLIREGDNYRIYDGDGNTPSRNGIFNNHARIDGRMGHLLEHEAQLQIGQDAHNQIILTYFNPVGSAAAIPSKLRLDLKNLREWPVELGRDPDPHRYASIQLDSPVVSRRHASIFPDTNGGHSLQDFSSNGTFVNDRAVDRFIKLKNGDRIRIGPFLLVYTKDTLEIADRGNQIRLDAFDLVRRVKDKTGQEKTILDGVSLAIEPGQLVALVGGSGAGKSTLMKTLLGIEPTTSGTVYLNGDDLRRHFDLYRSQLGYVPQDDIVHPQLTVAEVLSYACQLRLPPDTAVAEVVDRTLEQIKLSHVRNTFIRDLSGGQRKRVSIGVELLADPKLFFLDEPTSGLDPGLDKEMMNLLRELADQGRTVILVTHATSNIETCDRIAFMGRGGKLCYFGKPQEALEFFEMPAIDLKYFADIYLKLDRGKTKEEVQNNIAGWAYKFLNSPYYQTYVKAALSPGGGSNIITKPKRGQTSFFRQLFLLSQRYAQLVWRDRFSLILALLTGPIGISLIYLAIGGEDPLIKPEELDAERYFLALRVLFVFSCIAIWVGVSSAAQEIVKEAAIYSRERLVNLGLFAYLGSKVLIRSIVVIAQTLLLIGTILIAFQAPPINSLFWLVGLLVTNFLTLFASICLGLLISTIVKNENEANNSLPLIMIPQIIFSGVLFDLSGVGEQLSWLMLSHWSVGAYGVLVDVNSLLPQAVQAVGEVAGISEIEPNSFYEPIWQNLVKYWIILGLSALGYLSIASVLQKRKDIH
jgi:ABC transport system ATP-binding/permease protein